MDIIRIGNPVITRMGTVVTRYVENGRLYKSVDFSKSANKHAQQKGLIKTVVRYGEKNKPECVYDTFERRIARNEAQPTLGIEPPKSKRGRKKGSVAKSKVAEPKKETSNNLPTEPKPAEKKPEVKVPPKIKPAVTKPAPKPTGITKPIINTIPADGQRLVKISTDSFKRESAKQMYSGIRKYVRLAGENGSISNAKIMTEIGKHDNKTLDKGTDILLSVDRRDNKTHLVLGRRHSDKSSDTLFDALFNKDGQMIEGRHPIEHLSFERRGANVRRMKKHNTQFMPIAGNDREWDYNGLRISGTNSDNLWYSGEDDAVGGAFEIFIEFARLYTSILK